MADTELFTAAEARMFDRGQLADSALYPDATITAFEAGLRTIYRDICGVAFVRESATEYGMGDDCPSFRIKWPLPVTLTSITGTDSAGTGTAFTAAELALCYFDTDTGTIVRRDGSWFSSLLRYTVVYTHGYETVPTDVEKAALRDCMNHLVPTNLPAGADSGTEYGIDWTRNKDVKRERWRGDADIDGVLNRYRMRYYIPGVA